MNELLDRLQNDPKIQATLLQRLAELNDKRTLVAETRKNRPVNIAGEKQMLNVWEVRENEKESHYFWSGAEARRKADNINAKVHPLGKQEVHILEVRGRGLVTRFVGENVHGETVTEENLGTF